MATKYRTTSRQLAAGSAHAWGAPSSFRVLRERGWGV